MTDASTDPDHRLKKLRFRAWRRGFREIDLILGRFADQNGEILGEADLLAFEALLDQEDQDVYAWIIGQIPTPAAFETPLMGRLRAFVPGAAA
ncbi:MAG: succinate dehydrogenase assembly factor 2 [Pseudomonadota bacterium]|nr:succinate dehydrogenase assembly factor 2 [Pseudomonadota bacterium]